MPLDMHVGTSGRLLPARGVLSVLSAYLSRNGSAGAGLLRSLLAIGSASTTTRVSLEHYTYSSDTALVD